MINFNKQNQELLNFLNSKFFQEQRLQSFFHNKIKNLSEWNYIIKKYDNFLLSSQKIELIPKVIHQIWIGSKIPKKYTHWARSWKKNNPDYDYILWDEKKILQTGLINERQFLKNKNYGVKSDIARYELLYKYGGIYIDTDFECLKIIDPKLLCYSFVAGNLFDYKPLIANGMMMSSPKHSFIKLLIDELSSGISQDDNESIFHYSGPQYLTNKFFQNKNLLEDALILPSQYFYPFPHFMLGVKNDRYKFISDKTIGIHHWEVSWIKRNFFLNIIFNIWKILKNDKIIK